MSDRKYRQRGYQDTPGDRGAKAPRPAPEPRAPGRQLQDASGPRTPKLMGFHEVFRCARCGTRLSVEFASADRCPKCSVGLHSCINCVSFDTGARWECTERALEARVSPKDESNVCPLFMPRTTVERQTGTPSAPATGSTTAGSPSARQAFEDLFK